MIIYIKYMTRNNVNEINKRHNIIIDISTFVKIISRLVNKLLKQNKCYLIKFIYSWYHIFMVLEDVIIYLFNHSLYMEFNAVFVVVHLLCKFVRIVMSNKKKVIHIICYYQSFSVIISDYISVIIIIGNG